MGCTCGYQGIDNKNLGFEEFQERKSQAHLYYQSSRSNMNEEMMRITSMSRISSQRSVMLKNLKKQKENKEPMKIGKFSLLNLY